MNVLDLLHEAHNWIEGRNLVEDSAGYPTTKEAVSKIADDLEEHYQDGNCSEVEEQAFNDGYDTGYLDAIAELMRIEAER